MRRWIGITLGMAIVTSSAVAQNQPSPEQLQTMYQDALNQLKAAQDRKNELAIENQKLQKKQAELEKQLAADNQWLASVRQQNAAAEDFRRAWEDFVSVYPPLRSLWSSYVSISDPPPRMVELLGDGTWPFTIEDE